MKRLISAKTAGIVLLTGLLLLAVFHLAVILKLVPSSIVWGGQVAAADSGMIVMEAVALGVTLLFALIVIVKQGYVLRDRFRTAARIGMWIIAIFFALSTVGNLASSVIVENLIFAPIALLLAILAFRLVIERESGNRKIGYPNRAV